MTAPRHFLTLMDLAPDEIRALIARAIELKARHRAGTAPRSLEGKVFADLGHGAGNVIEGE